MRTSDLQTGMRVQLSNSTYADVIDSRFGKGLLKENNETLVFLGYNEDMTRRRSFGGEKEYNIQRVYSVPKSQYMIPYLSVENRDLLWERAPTKIKEEKSIFTKSDLKDGDFVLCKNGIVAAVLVEKDTLLTRDGFMEISVYTENLTHLSNSNWDIMQVRRPESRGDAQFGAFKRAFGRLIFERKEVKEMTMQEVCTALGYEVKIIKE